MPKTTVKITPNLTSPAMTPKFYDTQLKLLERRLAIRDAE